MQVDYFVILGQEHRADLDGDVIRNEFQRLSRQCHPDAGGELQEFEQLNQAHSVLSEPASRLRHLYELEFGQFPSATGAFSPRAMELFAVVGEALDGATAYIRGKAGATTAIARALIARDEVGVQRSVIDGCGQVRLRREELLSGLEEIDRVLGCDRTAARELIEATCRELSFLAKWERQLNESMAALIQ
ncbi:MAG: DnaJ domain-containing protein [Verrucomicrobiales bacterium]|nr:DnaJ domain-containing protein [Verrucomicrobiales bacterium]